MKRIRVSMLAAMIGLVSSASLCLADSFPNRPIRMVVGFAAGGGTDLIGRILADQLSSKMNATVVVENMPGAGTTIAAASVARSAPDGYTIMLATSSVPINQTLQKKLPYDARTDLVAIAMVGNSPFCMIVRANNPIKSFKEFMAQGKESAKGFTYGSGGVGSVGNLAAELFKSRTGIKAIHVPYRGNAPAIAGLLSGDVDFVFADLASALSHIRAGTVRALAVTTAERVSWLPDVPTIAESGVPGYEVLLRNYLLTSSQVPADIVAKLRNGVNLVFKNPDKLLTDRYQNLGVIAPPINTEPMPATFLKSEVDFWNKVITGANIKPN